MVDILWMHARSTVDNPCWNRDRMGIEPTNNAYIVEHRQQYVFLGVFLKIAIEESGK
jgi:hypothetical protein